MISSRSRTWWQQFSTAGILFALVSCSGTGTQQDPVDFDEPGAIEGELAVYIADFEDGTSETQYFLRIADGDERRLVLQSEPDIAAGTRVKVWGSQNVEAIDVTNLKVAIDPAAGGIGSQSSAVIDTTPRKPRVFCPVLVTLNNGAIPSTLGTSQVESQFHSGPTSVNAYYIENSYKIDSTGGKTYGPFNYNMSSCSTSALATAIRPMIPSEDGCQQYGWVMVPRTSFCGWAGLGQVGTSDRPARDTWYNGTLGCVATVQEPGHNLGMLHSSSINCGQTGITDSLSTCTHSEYGDRFDTMGGGCRHMNAWQKLYEKWWGGCNAVKVTSSGTFNLYPTEVACNGVQALQIPFPGGKTRSFQGSTLTSWYLEYRTPTGFDQGIAAQVLVHIGINPVLPTQTNPRGNRVWIVNASGTSTAPGLTAGKSIADPAGGLTITVMSMDATKAVVQIDYPGGSGNSPVCLDGMNTPFQPPGPTDCTQIPTRPDGGAVNTGTGGSTGTNDAGRDAAGDRGGSSVGVGGSVGQ